MPQIKSGIGDERPSGQSMQRLDGRAERAMANHHPTVKPIKLMTYLCRLTTPSNGILLEPFMGSGSTGIAAKQEGFDFIGIEMNEEYLEIATQRIKKIQKKIYAI
jgi:site-specific DNA-methyltransferase (adenine-specific)